MKKPTKKQVVLLDFIEEFTLKNDFSPSYREIREAMGLRSVSAVAEHVENCVAAGFLKKEGKAARSLVVVKPETYEETVRLFRRKMGEVPDEDAGVLRRAAKILEIEV
ncbi:MAG: hypothetical protein LBT19_00845 [Candidatus Nomurabacteria bacterium]|jgi:SOS-response transcriptional repressor LexA|nr:hypothetical protein [Candidatus Nomurabacteria bacterium]